MSKKNLILMILPEFGYGGAEKSFCALSVELSKSYHVKIVVFNTLRAPVYPIGGEVISLDVNASSSYVAKAFNFIKRTERLRKIKRNLRPDVSISFLEGANYINLLSSSSRERTIISIRGSKIFDQNISRRLSFLRKKVLTPFLYSKANFIVALSAGIKFELTKCYSKINPKQIVVIYNYADEAGIRELANDSIEADWGEYLNVNKVLVTSSRLAEEKGIHLFLPVFSELVKATPNLKLLIIGDGEFLVRLQEISKNLGLSYNKIPSTKISSHQVHFLGYQPNPFKWIKKSEVYISSSIHEGFGNSILEAIYCGTPVISTDCPYGPREILTDIQTNEVINYPLITDHGLILPMLKDNSKQWVLVLGKFLQRRITIQCTELGEARLEKFKLENFSQKWLDTIKMCLDS